MILSELSILQKSLTQTNKAPFVYQQMPGRITLPDYWTDTFGAADESVTSNTFISSVLQLPSTYYTKTTNLDDCIALEESFYWDNTNQILYTHFNHEFLASAISTQYGQVLGFSDGAGGVVYVDNLAYTPLLQSYPNISQSEDQVISDQLSFISGTSRLSNVGGELDNLNGTPIFGNDYSLYFLDAEPGKTDYVRGDIVQLAALYVEDYTISRQYIDLNIQDKRKAQNIKILTEKTARDELVPKAYGPIRCALALVDELESVTTGPVSYRIAQEITAIGTVQVKVGEDWVTKTPTSVDLLNGKFILSAADARDGDTARECRVLNFTGVANTTAADIIYHLNESLLGLPIATSFYDIDEINVAVADLVELGVYFNQQKNLYDAIKDLQNGSNIRFRYEIKADGRRTIRTDDWTRISTYDTFIDVGGGDTLSDELGNNITADGQPRPAIGLIDIKDSDKLAAKTNTKAIAASVTINYDKDYCEDVFKIVENTDYLETFSNKYHQSPSMSFDTFLTNPTDAAARALWSAQRLSEVRPILQCQILGTDWYTLRIYDILDVDLTISSTRAFLGRWKCQVLEVDPQVEELCNRVKLMLIQEL